MLSPLLQQQNPFYQSPEYWLLECELPFRHLDVFTEALSDESLATGCFEKHGTDAVEPKPDDIWVLQIYFDHQPPLQERSIRAALLAQTLATSEPELTLSLQPARDWVSDIQQHYPPIQAGRFFIHNSTYEGRTPHGSFALEIDAGQAFGTGEHETTSLCLQALSDLANHRTFTHMLDVGTGTGVLAMAMAQLWKQKVIALDIDAKAVEITQKNAEQNRLAQMITARQANGYQHPLIRKHGPYDLITANILARPLMQMATDLRTHLAEDGVAVLSGFLTNQEPMLRMAHRFQGLKVQERYTDGAWSALVLTRS